MVVVIEPSENRSAIAKPPVKKLDAEMAGKISDERKCRRNGRFMPHSIKGSPSTQESATKLDEDARLSIMKKFGTKWRRLTSTTT